MARRKTIRRGLGKGLGRGYKNIIPQDPRVHSDSAKGRKQPQFKLGTDVISRITKVKGKVIGLNPLVVKYRVGDTIIAKITNPKFWKTIDDEEYNIKYIPFGVALPLKNKGFEVIVWENFREGDEWNSKPYTRYFLLKDGKQIDGMDVQSKKFNKKQLISLLKRNKIQSKKINVFIK